METTSSRDGTLDSELGERGYATRPLLPPQVVDSLLNQFGRLGVGFDTDVHRTFIDSDRATATEVDAAIRRAVLPHLERLLPERDVVLATFVHKGPGGGAAVDFHQDLTFTDERAHRAIAIWIPLVDVDGHRGALALVPGSHRWVSGIRTHSEEVSGATVPLQNALAAIAITHPLSAGDAVVYDTATIHGSAPNTTTGGRPAVVIVTVPRGAPMVHFIERTDGVEGFEIDDAYFCTWEFGRRPDDRRPVTPWAAAVRAADLAAHLGGRPCP